MQLTDTHCHLQFKQYTNIAKVIDDASKARVGQLICVGTTLPDSEQAVSIAGQNDTVWAAAGVHPHDAEEYNRLENADEKLSELLAKPKIMAIGEIGLDYYKNYSPKDQQIIAFRKQLEVGLKFDLPFIFHVRDAWDDFWPIIDEYKIGKGVIHSFSAHQEQLDQCIKRGFYIGLNGIMTFTHDRLQLDAAKNVPLDKLLLETDAPFLTPAPHRGKLCEPKHIADIAQFLAKLRGEEIDQLARATTKNANTLFELN